MSIEEIIRKIERGKQPGILPEQLDDVVAAAAAKGIKIETIRMVNQKQVISGINVVFGMGDEQKDIERSDILRRSRIHHPYPPDLLMRPASVIATQNPEVRLPDLAKMMLDVTEAYAGDKSIECAIAIVERLKIYFAQKDCYYKLPKDFSPVIGVKMIPTLDRLIEFIKLDTN